MTRAVFAVTAICISLAGLPAQENPGSLESHYELAQQAQQQGNYARAADEWEAIVRLSPQLAEAHANLGMMYHLQNQPEAAIGSFSTALRLNPRLSSARLFLGIDFYQISRPDRAVEELQQVVSQDSHDPLARKWLGLSYLYAGNRRRAVTELRLCHSRDPRDEDVTFNLSRAYLGLSTLAFEFVGSNYPDSGWDHLIKGEQYAVQTRYSEALVEFQRALTVNPSLSGIHFRRATVFEAQGNAGSAIAEYGKELLSRPRHMQSIINLVQLLRKVGLTEEADEALSLARTSLKEYPRTLAMLTRLAEQNPAPDEKKDSEGEGAQLAARNFLGEYAKGIRTLSLPAVRTEQIKSALDRSDSEDALRLLASPAAGMLPDQVQEWKAQAWMAQNEFDQAFEVFLLRTAKDSKNPEYSYYLGVCAEKLALSLVEEFVRTAPDSYRTYQLQAEYHLAQSDTQKAISMYKKVLSLKPNAVRIHLGLGKIYQSEDHYDQAITEYEAELKADSYSVPALESMGEVEYRLGRPDAAKKYLLEAISINPHSPDAHFWLGKVSVQEGSPAEAVGHFRAALQGSVKDPGTVYFELSRALRQLGNIEEADKYMVLFRQSKAEKSRIEQNRRFETP